MKEKAHTLRSLGSPTRLQGHAGQGAARAMHDKAAAAATNTHTQRRVTQQHKASTQHWMHGRNATLLLGFYGTTSDNNAAAET